VPRAPRRAHSARARRRASSARSLCHASRSRSRCRWWRSSSSRLEPDARLLRLADLFPWIDVGSLRVDVAFAVDPLSAVMILVVTGIGG
jgi:hypothetical protein